MLLLFIIVLQSVVLPVFVSPAKINLKIFDPVADLSTLDKENKKYFLSTLDINDKYDVILLTVPHKLFLENPQEYFKNLLTKDGFIYDLKGVLEKRKYIIRP